MRVRHHFDRQGPAVQFLLAMVDIFSIALANKRSVLAVSNFLGMFECDFVCNTRRKGKHADLPEAHVFFPNWNHNTIVPFAKIGSGRVESAFPVGNVGKGKERMVDLELMVLLTVRLSGGQEVYREGVEASFLVFYKDIFVPHWLVANISFPIKEGVELWWRECG